MKPTMKELLKEWRANLNEHVTDEEHEHPHADESDEHHCGDESLNEVDQGLGATTFEEWVANDDSVSQVGSPGNQEYEWACDPTGGDYEMEFIIKRIRELYSLGGSIEKIQIMRL